jgi:predicted RNA-binding Zn-ribbon protein involved in translation (DUF1610 family)
MSHAQLAHALPRYEHVKKLAHKRRAAAARALRRRPSERTDAVGDEDPGELPTHAFGFLRRPGDTSNGVAICENRRNFSCSGTTRLVIIRTISGGDTDTVHAGTLAGAGCFRCDSCGYAVAMQELDEVPACPHCGGEDFRRSSMFGELSRSEATGLRLDDPDWLAEAREALVTAGDYIAYDDDDRVRVVVLQDGWTRVGRSLSAHLRFDDPTVSRRHALLHRQDGGVRILDDRSLNGVFVNGSRVDMRELADGDQIAIGRFQLHYISLADRTGGNAPDRVGAGVP